MAIRAAINGFGRIGRNVLRSAKKSGNTEIDFVAVNDLTDAATLAHLLKYDSVHGRYPGTVEVSENGLVVDGDEIRVLSERDPAARSVLRLSEAHGVADGAGQITSGRSLRSPAGRAGATRLTSRRFAPLRAPGGACPSL